MIVALTLFATIFIVSALASYFFNEMNSKLKQRRALK
jgi:hypothetical protein